MASLFVVVVFAGGVPVWEVLDAGGPPQPYYADYVIGQIDLGAVSYTHLTLPTKA